eukprot:6053823-Alexandrium_andersonii.AAC.1
MAARCPGRSVGRSLPKPVGSCRPAGQRGPQSVAPAGLPATEKTAPIAQSGRPFLRRCSNWSALRGPS